VMFANVPAVILAIVAEINNINETPT